MYPLHNHGAWLNKEGSGNTDVDAGHYHRVVNFRVQADPSDGHTHELTMLPCGAGAAQTTGRDGPMTSLQGSDDLVTFLGAAEPPKFSLLPWLVGAVVVSGLVIGGVMLMRSDEE